MVSRGFMFPKVYALRLNSIRTFFNASIVDSSDMSAGVIPPKKEIQCLSVVNSIIYICGVIISVIVFSCLKAVIRLSNYIPGL